MAIFGNEVWGERERKVREYLRQRETYGFCNFRFGSVEESGADLKFFRIKLSFALV